MKVMITYEGKGFWMCWWCLEYIVHDLGCFQLVDYQHSMTTMFKCIMILNMSSPTSSKINKGFNIVGDTLGYNIIIPIDYVISIVFFYWKFNHVGDWIIPTLVNKINHLQGEYARSIMNYSSNLACYVLIDIHGMMSYNVARLYIFLKIRNIFWLNCQQCKISHRFTTQTTKYKIK